MALLAFVAAASFVGLVAESDAAVAAGLGWAVAPAAAQQASSVNCDELENSRTSILPYWRMVQCGTLDLGGGVRAWLREHSVGSGGRGYTSACDGGVRPSEGARKVYVFGSSGRPSCRLEGWSVHVGGVEWLADLRCVYHPSYSDGYCFGTTGEARSLPTSGTVGVMMRDLDGKVRVPDDHADLEIDVLSGSDRIGRGGHEVELRLRLMVPTGEVIQRPLSEPIVVRAPVANKPVDALALVGPTGRGAEGVPSSAWWWWAGHEGAGGGPGGWTVTKPEVTGRHDLRFAGDSRYIRYTCTGTGTCGRPPNGRQLHSMSGLQGWWWHKRTTRLTLFGTGPSHDCDSAGWAYFASAGGSWVRLSNPRDDCSLSLASDTRPWFTAEQSEDVDGILRVKAEQVGGDAPVTCGVTDPSAYPSQAAGYTCFTDANGEFVIRYRVPISAADRLRGRRDILRIYVDYDQDGTHDHAPGQPGHEPSGTVGVPVAKAVNYVALGDSYSAGENGDTPELGAYQGGISDADAECRRWDQAYPYIFNRDFLKTPQLTVDVTFKTFACTGAITLNIYDPADPNGDSLEQGHAATNRPSPHAPRAVPLRDASSKIVLHREPGWEQRQGASLAGVETMRDVDMVTLTIGGNDAEFGRALLECAFVSECDAALSSTRLGEIENQVVDVLDRIKAKAPDAVVFVLGYPYLTPKVDPCANPKVIRRAGRPPRVELSFDGLPAGCEEKWDMYRPGVAECDSLSATGVVRGSGYYVGGTVAHFFVGAARTRIDYREAKALWAAADELNAAVARAARRAGAHFVDVVGGVPLDRAPEGFVGHSSCNTADAWMNGFVPKEGLLRDRSGADGSSFHPTAAGQRAYADILEAFIRSRIDAGAPLSEAGLPRWTAPSSEATRGAGSQRPAAAKQEDSGTGIRGAAAPAASAGLLAPRAATSVSGCGAPFVIPGEQITLTAAGFAANAAVTFAVQAASLGAAQIDAPQIPVAAADGDGMLSALWTVPSAPAAATDPAPRAYLIDASGPNPAGGTHTALMGLAMVAYPGAAPCAVADTASTALGAAVQIAVLTNDIGPTGGTLEASSVVVRDALGGSFAVDAATGAVTFTPDGGFWGTVETTYVVYDSWGIGVETALTVTVDAGCTITGTVGETTITGTDGDDVICVPDPEDRRAFHVIDAKGGNDIVLGGAGVEWVYGGEGADVVYGRGGGDRIVPGAGADIVYGGLGLDRVYSADLTDTVIDDEGGHEMVVAPSVAVAQSGPVATDDWAWVDVDSSSDLDVLANDYDRGGDLGAASLEVIRSPGAGAVAVAVTDDGRMVVNYTAAAAGGMDSFSYRVCDALGECASAEVTVMVGTAGCTITGTAASETLRGTPGDDVICGGGGDDTIYGAGGDDILVGGAGADRLYGDAGDDLLHGGVGVDSLRGGPDDDILWGGGGDDNMEGNRGADRLYGGDGDDTAQGGLGDDALFGGNGADRVFGGEGDDRVHGGAGDDLVRGGEQDDALYGGPGDDTLIGWTGADRLWGGSGDDNLRGDAGDDALWGGLGDDTLRGNGHDDQLQGGTGDDALFAGPARTAAWGAPAARPRAEPADAGPSAAQARTASGAAPATTPSTVEKEPTTSTAAPTSTSAPAARRQPHARARAGAHECTRPTTNAAGRLVETGRGPDYRRAVHADAVRAGVARSWHSLRDSRCCWAGRPCVWHRGRGARRDVDRVDDGARSRVGVSL